MYDLDETILARRSSRLYLRDKPVPRELVIEAVELATHAPSNSNVQPGHVVFASGPARDRLVEALLREARSKPPKVPPLPQAFATAAATSGRRIRLDGNRTPRLGGQKGCSASQLGVLPGAVGRHRLHAPRPGPPRQRRRRHVPADPGARTDGTRPWDVCAGVDRGLPETVREHLGIGEEMRILCGLSIGYPDPDFPGNKLRVPRNPLGDNVVFVDS
jgi:nitroreductase